MASLQGSQPLHAQYSSYFPPAPKRQPSKDMERPSTNQNAFRFPLTKNILWDQTPVGPSVQLYPWHTRNISLDVSEAAVRLAHRHALQADTQPHHGFLVGSMVIDPDEEGLTVTLDRFDPGRDVPGRNARLPTIKLPADFIVPLTTFLGDADISATHTSDDFITAFKLLESNLSTHGSVDPSRCLTLRAMCRCYSNTDDITLCLHFGAVMVATVFNGFPVRPIPIIPTALARNLMGPMPLSDVQGSYKTGFLSMDKTRKLLLLLESDPKTSTIPLIGIWLSGITHMSNPVVWSACLRFINSSGIQERVCSPNGGFLVVLFTRTSRQPIYFYECMAKTEQEPKFTLVGCRENLHIFKHASAKGKPPVQMELTPARSGPSKSLFMQSLAQLTSTKKHPRPSSRRRSSATDSMLSGMSNEESQSMPRPSPKPILDKSPSVMPSVPELSFISDSFCEPIDQRTTNQVTNIHPEHQAGRNVYRQRLNGQSEGTTKGRNGQVSVNRRRLHGTSKTPPQRHIQLSSVVKGTDRVNQQNRPGPLRALNGQELDNARRKGSHTSDTNDVGIRTSQLKDKSGRTLPIQSSGFGSRQRQREKNGQDRYSAPHSSHRHSTGGSAKDRNLCASVHGRPGNRLQHQQIQQPKASSQNQGKCDIPSQHILPEQTCQRLSEPSVGIDSVPPHHQPGTPTSHCNLPINIPLVNTEVNGCPNMHFYSSDTAQDSNSNEGQSYPETSDHHQDCETAVVSYNPSPKTVTNHGHSNPMSTAPEGHLHSPVCNNNENDEGDIVQHAQSSMDRISDAPMNEDQSRSGLDTKTLEQLQRQEEMIQQLQEQIKLLLQAHIPQPLTSTPLGLITPPATPQGLQNMPSDPKVSPHDHQVHNLAGTGLHHYRPDPHSHNQSSPAVVPSPHRQQESDAPTPESIARTQIASTSMTAITIHQQATIATSNRPPLQTPVMCSMAVNTGQSLFWSSPGPESPHLPSDQGLPKTTRHTTSTSHGLEAMPDSTSIPTGTQCSIAEQSSDVQERSSDVLQETRKEMETINVASCSESAGTSSHSAQSSQQHTPNCSPERSHDGSSFGADLSSPTLGESASTYAPPRHSPHESDTETSDSDEEEEQDEEEDENERRGAEEEKRANMASPSLLYRDEKRFYDNLLGQVQQLLHTDGTESPSPTIPECSNEPDLPRALPDISMATLEELEKLGINLHTDDITITDRSLYRSLYNVSPDLHPHINYVSLADFTFDPSDLSMEANAIAMKYLSDGELAMLSAGFQGDKTPGRRGGGVNPLLRSVLTGIREEGGARGGDVDSSMGVNMSLASRKYMEKYGLMSEGGADTAPPWGNGHLPKPSPVRFMKSPAIARTNLPTERKIEDKPRSKAKPTRLSYSPAKDTHQSKVVGVNTPGMTHQCEGVEVNTPGRRDTKQTSDPHPPNVLGHLKAQTSDKEQGGLREEDSSAKGNILDIGKLKQLPKLL